MRDRQPNKGNAYYLPNTLYRRVLSIVRDYDRRCEERDGILYESSAFDDGMPRGCGPGRPVERAAIKLSQIEQEIIAIDRALEQIPEEYARYIFDNIRYGQSYPLDYAARNTWSRWRSRFLYFVAKNMRLL